MKEVRATVLLALAAGVLFLVLAETVLLLQAQIYGLVWGPLSAEDTIALMVGSVTAAGLSAIYLQVHQASEAATRSSVDAQMAMALRADELHGLFNTREMRWTRNRAYNLLLPLQEHPDKLKKLARLWVQLTDKDDGSEFIPASGAKDFREYRWALSNILAFYVRVDAHIRAAELIRDLTKDEKVNLIRPFVWEYWEEIGLYDFVVACVSEQKASPTSSISTIYFAEPLKRLHDAMQPANQT